MGANGGADENVGANESKKNSVCTSKSEGENDSARASGNASFLANVSTD